MSVRAHKPGRYVRNSRSQRRSGGSAGLGRFTDVWLADQWYDEEVRPTTDDQIRREAEEDLQLEMEMAHVVDWD